MPCVFSLLSAVMKTNFNSLCTVGSAKPEPVSRGAGGAAVDDIY